MIAVQLVLSADDMPMGLAILTFSQMMGGAVWLAVAQVIFSHGLRENLGRFAPATDADVIMARGATAFRSFVPEAEIPGVLAAFSKAINWVFYLAVGLVAISFLASFGVGWKSVKKQKKAQALDSEEPVRGIGGQE